MNENTNQQRAARPSRQWGPPPATSPSDAQPVNVTIGAKTKPKRQKPITGPRLVGDEPVQ